MGDDIYCIFVFLNDFISLFIYFWLCSVFVATCGLFSSYGEWGLIFIAVHGPPILHDFSCCGACALGHKGFTSCGDLTQ